MYCPLSTLDDVAMSTFEASPNAVSAALATEPSGVKDKSNPQSGRDHSTACAPMVITAKYDEYWTVVWITVWSHDNACANVTYK